MTYKKYGTSPASHDVDHGYAWVVLASCFVMRMLVDSIYGSLGILFLKWQYHFAVDASDTAWVGSIFSFILLASAPLSSALGYRFTYKVVVFGAGIITFICFFALSFVTEFWQIMIIIPILSLAMGIPYQASAGFFTKYFDKRLALANNVCSAATAMGYVILPSMFEAIIINFGWRGALFIISAVVANFCVCGSLLRTPHLKGGNTSKSTVKYVEKPEQPGFFKDVARSFDLSLFLNIKFIFIGMIGGPLTAGLYLTLLFIIPNAVSLGIPELKASYLMTAYGLSNLISRLCPIGLLIDKNVISASKLTGITLLVCAIDVFIMAFSRTFVWLMVMAVIAGLTVGVSATSNGLVVFASAGSKEKAAGAMAWYYLSQGVGSLLCISLSGYLYVFTNSYRSVFFLSAACHLLKGIIILSEPCLHRWQTNLKKQDMEQIANV